MRKLALIFTSCFIAYNSYSQHLASLNEQEYLSNNFSNEKNTIKEDLNNVKVIGLGEGNHNIGTVFQAKVKMVKFLHEQLGYNVIAFESGMYDVDKANKILQSDTVKGKDIFNSLFGMWWCSEVKELVDYIIETKRTAHSLKIAGFDNQFTGIYSTNYFAADFSKFIDSLNSTTGSKIIINAGFELALKSVISKSNTYSKVSIQDTSRINQITQAALINIDRSQLASNQYWSFWASVCRNMQNDYRKLYCKDCYLRDKNMAANVSWLANDQYPDDKIILWAASIHLAYGTNEISDKDYQYPTMGTFLKQEFKEKYYALAFSPGSGTGGYKNTGIMSYKIKPPTKQSIESIFWNLDVPYSFMSFRSKENVQYVSKMKLTSSKIFWRKEIEMNIPAVVDGMFYIKRVNAPIYITIDNGDH